jgi:hypothetical protein
MQRVELVYVLRKIGTVFYESSSEKSCKGGFMYSRVTISFLLGGSAHKSLIYLL